mgnify:CR=1 FL=1
MTCRKRFSTPIFSETGKVANNDHWGGLQPLFDWAGLTLLDVGARGGPLPWMHSLAPFTRYVACEPQADAAIAPSAGAGPWAAQVIVREALAADMEHLQLHLTAKPGFSSALPPDQDMAERYFLADEMKVVGAATVPAISLARAAELYGFEDLDFIKLDTQGSELAIMRSGDALIAGAVQAVHVECEFRPFYKDQPLFADIVQYLRARGFDLVGLELNSRRRRLAQPAAYSRPEAAWAHAGSCPTCGPALRTSRARTRTRTRARAHSRYMAICFSLDLLVFI